MKNEKNLIICLNCGKIPIGESVLFCPECGFLIDKNKIICKKCLFVPRKEDSFCRRCGQFLKSIKVVETKKD